jgi:hypothetical protein
MRAVPGRTLAAFPAAAQDTPRPGGTRRLSSGTLDTSDFHRRTGSISLTSIPADGQPRGSLAESCAISEDGRS